MAPRDEQWYRQKLAASGVPEHMHDGYVRYLLNYLEPGHFLYAVLMNDLKEACARADEKNAAALTQHVFFLYNYAPASCWGSVENVMKWLHQQAEL
jgi:hypothetical protein